MPFVERLHPRDGDGKFAREPGGGRGGMQITSRVRNGPAVNQHRPEHRPAPGTDRRPATATPVSSDTAPETLTFTSKGGLHIGRSADGASEYHLKRIGARWAVFVGDPAENRRVANAPTIGEAKAAAQAHAGVQHPPVVVNPAAVRWSSSGGLHIGRSADGASEYHLKRIGARWAVFVGDPAENRRVANAPTIGEARAAAEAHAAGTLAVGPAREKPARPVPPADTRETVVTSARPPRVSPTTAQTIRDARAAMPASTVDGWHRAATITLAPSERKKLADDAARLAAKHQGNIAKLNKIKDDYITATVAAMKSERDRGYHTRYDATGKQVEIGDEEIEARVAASAINQPKFLAQQKIAIASLMASSTAQFAYEDADSGDLLPSDDATGLLMPSPKLNEALDTALGAGRAFLADAKREFERTATPTLNRGQAALNRIDALGGPVAAADNAYYTIQAGNGPVDVALPDGSTVTLTHTVAARDLEERLRRELSDAYDEARPYRKAVLRHQQQVLLAMLADQRPMGGVHHDSAYPMRDPEDSEMQPREPRADWKQRLSAAEAFFPDTWLARHADEPLTVGASNRAYYTASQNHISFNTTSRDEDRYDGAFADKTGEVAVHEMGHRMEQYVPGLTALEFAFVRRRATRADATVEPLEPLPGYDDSERGQKDDWALPYAGKSYERSPTGRGPHERPWEVFQVGVQDTFGRSSDRYGRKSDPDELQAFVLGALLTL